MSIIKRHIVIQNGTEYADCVMSIPWRYFFEHKDTYQYMLNPEITASDCLRRMAKMTDEIDDKYKKNGKDVIR